MNYCHKMFSPKKTFWWSKQPMFGGHIGFLYNFKKLFLKNQCRARLAQYEGMWMSLSDKPCREGFPGLYQRLGVFHYVMPFGNGVN